MACFVTNAIVLGYVLMVVTPRHKPGRGFCVTLSLVYRYFAYISKSSTDRYIHLLSH